ncbi:MAG TPA: tRNA glutamyl-Q(34) synthetase GluQRS [Gammaproteobacteria bacterium]|nr:tRNA glutamyl-Q(34) synthetase GluQRS [Gammaproteobacteria bacterium]
MTTRPQEPQPEASAHTGERKSTGDYRGRFAPSPTGPLHFGSLIAAVGSYLDARHHGGEWLLRIEDLDPPREVPGATDAILRTLDGFGLYWDGAVIYQSRRDDLYATALEELARKGCLYGCACTRREIADSAIRSESGLVYPGTCRNGLPPGRHARTLRVRSEACRIQLVDRLQGALQQQLDREVGDFILRRADGLFAYQLAVVVDDAAQQITHVVRGADLLDSTPRQIYLQSLLELPTLSYLHLPVAVDADAEKLGKQTFARDVTADEGGDNAALLDVLGFLSQQLPDSPRDASREELWKWAINHWEPDRIIAGRPLPAPAAYSAKITKD